jgi:dihydroorotate dehydrogenase (NAD+) catalytic subunit
MAGATAVQVGTNTFANPMTMLECIEGLAEFMKRKGYKNIQEMKGIAQ